MGNGILCMAMNGYFSGFRIWFLPDLVLTCLILKQWFITILKQVRFICFFWRWLQSSVSIVYYVSVIYFMITGTQYNSNICNTNLTHWSCFTDIWLSKILFVLFGGSYYFMNRTYKGLIFLWIADPMDKIWARCFGVKTTALRWIYLSRSHDDRSVSSRRTKVTPDHHVSFHRLNISRHRCTW